MEDNHLQSAEERRARIRALEARIEARRAKPLGERSPTNQRNTVVLPRLDLPLPLTPSAERLSAHLPPTTAAGKLGHKSNSEIHVVIAKLEERCDREITRCNKVIEQNDRRTWLLLKRQNDMLDAKDKRIDQYKHYISMLETELSQLQKARRENTLADGLNLSPRGATTKERKSLSRVVSLKRNRVYPSSGGACSSTTPDTIVTSRSHRQARETLLKKKSPTRSQKSPTRSQKSPTRSLPTKDVSGVSMPVEDLIAMLSQSEQRNAELTKRLAELEQLVDMFKSTMEKHAGTKSSKEKKRSKSGKSVIIANPHDSKEDRAVTRNGSHETRSGNSSGSERQRSPRSRIKIKVAARRRKDPSPSPYNASSEKATTDMVLRKPFQRTAGFDKRRDTPPIGQMARVMGRDSILLDLRMNEQMDKRDGEEEEPK